MRVLICAAGSHGDVLPFIALGTALRARGCEVRLFTQSYFTAQVEAAGLACTPIGGDAERYQALVHDPDLTDSHKGMRRLAQAMATVLPEATAAMRAEVVPGETITVGSSLAFVPRLLWEADGVPTVTAHLAPVLLRSRRRLPRLGRGGIWTRLPPPVPAAVWRVLDEHFFDPVFAPGLNEFRQQIGLAPQKRVFDRWFHAGNQVIGLFPEWFAQPEDDWPQPLALTGFPLERSAAAATLPQTVSDFLAAGSPPVVFTAGTATARGGDFLRASAEACRITGRRGVLVTAHDDPVPNGLPEGVFHSGFVPFSALLPHAAAVVHHGGIGTTSYALAAGVPQLIRPMAYDQFDNSLHAQRLGVASELLPRSYTPDRAARALDRLIDAPGRLERCATFAERLRDHDGAGRAAEAVMATLYAAKR